MQDRAGENPPTGRRPGSADARGRRRHATLPRQPLAKFAHRELPADGNVEDDGTVLGGIGSDIYPAQAPYEYWMVTDRGPSGKAKLYVARIDPGHNILGGPFDDVAHSPSLEQAGPTAVTALTKTPLVDLTGLVSGHRDPRARQI
ncbi:MAG: hypothetical protein M3Z25_11595 [Actinomycetota bacterium]|nr:hypothetical protein [Actinomycetota bacterium]